MKKYIVDRIEEDIIVLEDEDTKEMVNVKKDDIGIEVNTGDLIEFKDGKYSINSEETESRKKRIKNKFELLKSKTIEK